jgi:hypothetical protein
VCERLQSHFAACDLNAIADLLAADFSVDDRRRVVNAGIRRGRDAAIDDARAIIGLGVTDANSTIVATRGERVVLIGARYSGGAEPSEAFHTDLLNLFEIDADERITAVVTFDHDEFSAALQELDARYTAGEAARYKATWQTIAGTYASVSRGELPALSPDAVNIDHRRAAAFAPGELVAYIRAGRELDQVIGPYVEVVHRLTHDGAIVTYAARGCSQEGFDAEWREITVSTVDGGRVNRCELFDEEDLDVALARFEELRRPVRRLENAATRLYQRFQSCFTARDWAALAETIAVDISQDDRRRVVSAEADQGRDAALAEARAVAEIGAESAASIVIAIRGERLALLRSRFSGRDQRPALFHTEFLCVIELDREGLIAQHFSFDPEDTAAAFAELDSRYLAGEAADHARAWSAIARAYGTLNRQEIPQTAPDFVDIDHRPLAVTGRGDLKAYLLAALSETAHNYIYVEAVHRLTELGAVVTHVASGTSREGFDAEWRMTDIFTVEGDLLSRCEMFDEANLDDALARFEELNAQTAASPAT